MATPTVRLARKHARAGATPVGILPVRMTARTEERRRARDRAATRSIRGRRSARRRCEQRTGASPDRRCNPGAARAAASCEPPAAGPDIQRAPVRRRSDRALAASHHRALTLGRRGRDSGRPEGPSRSNAARVGLTEARRDVGVTAAKRQLGHAYLSTTGTYLEGISSEEIIGAGQRRRGPTMHASAGGAMFGCGFGEAQRVVESLIRAGQHAPATS